MNKPLKRHPALVPLSKDHHLGLLLCWKIRKGVSKDIEPQRISNYVVYFFDEHLKRHFREEEEVLLSKLASQDELRKETEKQHNELYDLRESIGKNGNLKEDLSVFEKKLEAHIRFEERQLFPYLQEKFTEDELKEIAPQLSKEEGCDNWQDKFWQEK